MNNGDMSDIPTETLAETENYSVWSSVEPDGEKTYHVELGPVTVHFFEEEWAEFLEMIREAISDDDVESSDDIEIELDWGSLYFARDEWDEFTKLMAAI